MPHSKIPSNKQLVVLITGCTDGGIGCSLAKQFVSKGYKVYATSRNVATMSSLENSCILLPMDVTDPESIETCVEKILDECSIIDILINNAGVSVAGPLIDATDETINKTIQTDVVGLIKVTKEVAPIMIRNRNGTIVNIGSIAGELCFPYSGVYAASKAAVHSMSESLRLELKPFNVNVLVVKPGAVKSNIGKNNLYKQNVINEESVYMPVKNIIETIVGLSQKTSKAMDTDVFAKKTANWIVQKHHGRTPFVQFFQNPIYGILIIIGKMMSFIMPRFKNALSYFDDPYWNESHVLYLGGYSIFAKYNRFIPQVLKELFLWTFFKVGHLRAAAKKSEKNKD